MTKQILRNIASNYLRLLVGIVSALLIMPLILAKLGPQTLGLWALTNAIVGYFSLTDLGIISAAIKYISHYRATQQWDELNKTISTSLMCFTYFAVVSLVGGVVAGQIAPLVFHIPPDLIPTARILLLIMGLLAAIGFVSVIPIQCAIAAQRLDLLNTRMLVVQITCVCLSVITVYSGGGIIMLACIQIFSGVCGYFIALALTRQYLPQARLRIRWHKDHGFLIASFAGFALLTTLSNRIIYCTDSIVIAHYLTMVAVAGYAIALKISDFIRSIVGCAAGVLGTFVCEAKAHEDVESLAIMWTEGAKWALTITMPICLLCVLSGSDLITGWVGRNYPESAVVLALLAVGQLFDTAQSTGFQILVNGGRIRLYSLVLAVEAALNLSLSLILIKPLGILGIAIGTLVPQVLRAGVFCPLFLSRFTGVGLTGYFRKSVLPACKAAALSMVLIVLYKVFGLHSGKVSLFALALLLAPCELAGMYFFCLSDEHRLRARRMLLQVCSKDLTEEVSTSFFVP